MTDILIGAQDTGAAPFMVRHETALRLSSTLAVKVGGAGDSWGRYVDNHVVEPDTRVVERDARLCVVFRVNECATPRR